MERDEAIVEYRRLLKEVVEHAREMQAQGVPIPWVYDREFEIRIERKSSERDFDPVERVL